MPSLSDHQEEATSLHCVWMWSLQCEAVQDYCTYLNMLVHSGSQNGVRQQSSEIMGIVPRLGTLSVGDWFEEG